MTPAFRLAATSDAARTVVTAANVLRIASSSIPSFPLQPPDLLGPDDDFLLGKLALQPLPQGLPVGTINFLRHDFDDGDAVFLRPAAPLPETSSGGPQETGRAAELFGQLVRKPSNQFGRSICTRCDGAALMKPCAPAPVRASCPAGSAFSRFRPARRSGSSKHSSWRRGFRRPSCKARR